MRDLNTLASKLKMPSRVEKFQIVDALLECNHMREGASRQTVLDTLNDEFPGIVNEIPLGTDNRMHTMNIVRTCLKRPGSLDTLVDIVAYLDGKESDSVQDLRKVMQDIFFEAPVVGQKLFDELIKVTARLHITRDQLQSMYLGSIPRFGWRSLDFDSIDADEPLPYVIQNLAQARPQTDGTLPLIEFVKLLGSVSELSVQKKLRIWIKDAAEYAGVADTDAVFPKQNVPAEQSEKTFSYLLVKIDPYYALGDESEENEFYVRAWFLEKFKSDTDKQNYEPLSTSNKRYTFKTLEQMLNKLVSVCIGKINAISRNGNMRVLMVEIFLRFAYLNHPDRDMHHWMIDRGFGYRKAISNVWPLVVRSLDRVDCDEPSVLYEWKCNWDRLKQQRTLAEPLFLSREYFEKAISLDGKIWMPSRKLCNEKL